MASIQGGGRPAVDEALSSDSGQSRAHVVADVLGRRVTNGPPGLNDPPHQVDIFPVAQAGIEPADLTDDRGSSDNRGSGHVPDPMSRTDHRGRRSEVERRVAPFVSEQYRRYAFGGSIATTRGDTAATLGSSKCPVSAASQWLATWSTVVSGSTSTSTKATSGVATLRRPELRALPGPRAGDVERVWPRRASPLWRSGRRLQELEPSSTTMIFDSDPSR